MNKPFTQPHADQSIALTSAPDSHPLTLAQKRIWSLHQIGNNTVFPPQILTLRWSPKVRLDQLQAALATLAARHDALRVRFHRFAGGRIELSAPADVQPPMEILGSESNPLRGREVEDAAAAFAARAFDLLNGSASRFQLVMAENGLVSTLVLHPIVCDCGAAATLREDLIACVAGQELPVVAGDFLARGAAEERYLETAELAASLQYWRQTIGEEYSAATLPTRFNATSYAGAARHHLRFAIDEALWGATKDFARRHALGPDQILMAAFAILLARCGGNYSPLLGTLLAGQTRSIARTEQILPLRLELSSRMTILEVCTALRSAVADAIRNIVPFERLIQEIQAHEEREQDAFVKSLFEFRPRPAPSALATDDAAPAVRSDVELALVATPGSGGGIEALFDYADGIYQPELIERAALHFERILAQAIAADTVRIKDIALVSNDEIAVLSAPYADDGVNDDRPVHDHISAHARQDPERTAIIHGDEIWTHGRLEQSANRLAHHLLRLGVGADVSVAIAVKRSPEAIMGILATLKAGGAYIPVEPDHPTSRNHHILRDGGVKVILTNSWLLDRIPDGLDAIILELDRLDLSGEPITPPDVAIHKDQLAYIMYTSGSTGLPKGVAVEHGPLTHHIQNTSRVYGMSEISRELPFLPFSSDGGHERWMNPLMEGGSIILPDQPLWTPEETLTAMRKHGANNASIPTTYLQQLAEWADATDSAPPMRLYSFGGEGLAQQTFDLLSTALKSEWLINGYGPTETIMTPMVWKVRAGEKFEGTYAPIGRAVGNRRVYVLDPDLNPCPIGVTGELYIGGEGVARGYIGKADITADRFIPDPFSNEGGRLYRSGDLTRWREDGTVEFVGRVDHQVKLRGYRIELGEIEAALLQDRSVGEALVVLRDDEATQQKMLVAYVVAKQGADIDIPALSAALERALPAYMVPSAIMPLAAMPINPNSKLDRFALPAPAPVQRQIVMPATALEEEILDIWREILNVDPISVEDNFFAIGGNSLGAIRILSALRRQKPQTPATIADLFNNPTIRSFAAVLEREDGKAGSEVIVLRASGTRPILYCFPGLLVSTREYVRLVDYLGPDQPATGFICYSLSEKKEIGASVDEIIESYVDYIRRTSAGQPCYFLGWSWGGLLAYEAARRLGNDIDLRLITMVDVCDLGTEFAIGAKPRFKPGERDHLHATVQQWLARTAMRAEWDRLLGVMDADTYDQFLRFVGDEKDELPTDGPDISSREHTFWILIDNALIFRRHELKPHDVPIHSWAADDSLNRGLNLIDWRRYSPRANPAEIISGTNHLHVIGSQAFHSRLSHRLEEAFQNLSKEHGKVR
ncbi:amino acid adenylation domain-containing protein [Phyllobacterium sp. 0TCS1.6C]|uniref:non-ribosomal peptide synthetase n=1 Tax=unclassified Phyllobacterium TaxID=2638441 RepID=UPI0022655841|nr:MULTISPECIES: amino acid adenylation domain-containing protein [unclassified Phyllobacterium]MCX8280366.1 amino acid adenylation domain-containing protein [Phyllobacterium sp. 0TCS1.6C]MCX8295185.1 amino acid adenylation domain-containing protein [Phyllobacterium sp. 0TCS1.6A]